MRWPRGSPRCQDRRRARRRGALWGRVELGSVLERGRQELIEAEVGLGVCQRQVDRLERTGLPRLHILDHRIRHGPDENYLGPK